MMTCRRSNGVPLGERGVRKRGQLKTKMERNSYNRCPSGPSAYLKAKILDRP